MIAHYYHMAAMLFWCVVFDVFWFCRLKKAYFWALNKAGGHSAWLQIEEEER